MKIGIVSGAFFPAPPRRGGGTEKLWYQLAGEFVRQGHEVIHVSRLSDGLAEADEAEGVRHRRVPGYDQPRHPLGIKWRDLRYSRRAVRLLPPQLDIIVTNTFWSPILLRRRAGVYVSVERMPKGQMRFYSRAARLRGCSTAVIEAILRECPSAADRVTMVPNHLPVALTDPVDWSRKQKRILYVGRIHPEKGIELLLEAFGLARARPALAGWSLELIGPSAVERGGGGEKWAEALRERHRHPAVGWRGPVYDSSALNAAYEQASVFAYPSLAEAGETFGLAPLEAMAFGAAPVVSDLACFRDFIRHCRNGLVFNHRAAHPAGDLAAALEEATIWRRELGQAAVAVRSTHSLEKIAGQFLADFEKVTRASGV